MDCKLKTRGFLGGVAVGCALFSALLMVSLTGCGSAVPRHTSGVWVGDAGSSSEVVFDSPTVLAAMDKAREEGRVVASADATWRDRSLSIRPAESAFDQASWPSWRRPTLDRPRRIYLNQRTDTVLFFQQETSTRTREHGAFFVP